MDPLTLSTGSAAPDFSLQDLAGDLHSLADLGGKIAILNFWSAECPWSEYADRVLLADLARWDEPVALWTIAANANEPLKLIQRTAKARGLPLVLLDRSQQVVDLYGALTTPHVFILDTAGRVRYQGALDDATFRQPNPRQHYARQAVEALLQGQQPALDWGQPYGCAIVRNWEA